MWTRSSRNQGTGYPRCDDRLSSEDCSLALGVRKNSDNVCFASIPLPSTSNDAGPGKYDGSFMQPATSAHATAAPRASFTALYPALEQEGIALHDGAAVGLGEDPLLHLPRHAPLDRVVLHGGRGDLRLLDRAIGDDHPVNLDLAGQRRFALQLLLVAELHRVRVGAHHAGHLLLGQAAAVVDVAGGDVQLHLVLLAAGQGGPAAAAAAGPPAGVHVARAVQVSLTGASAPHAAAGRRQAARAAPGAP